MGKLRSAGHMQLVVISEWVAEDFIFVFFYIKDLLTEKRKKIFFSLFLKQMLTRMVFCSELLLM